MTREEHIEILKQYREKPTLINEISSVEEAVWLDEALDAAIKALEQESCDDEELDFVQPHKRIPVNLEACDDAISRQAAIDGLRKIQLQRQYSINGTSELDKAFEVIENLPSVCGLKMEG